MLLTLAAALLDCIWLVWFHPQAGGLILELNLPLAVVAASAYVAIGTFGRNRAEAIVFVVLIAVDAATIALGLGNASLVLVAAGYVLLLPIIVSLVVPWVTKIQLTWLGLHVAMVLGFVVFTPEASVPAGAKNELIGLLIVAIAVSQFGHVANLRARVLGFTQIERIRALNRQARRDQARLDRLNTALARTARTDALTGLGNRVALDDGLNVVRSRIERQGERYGLLILDLDRFKAINDELGHVGGDGVLRATSAALLPILRPGDTAYRYGGEEFVVIIRLDRPRDALVAAERIRRAIENLEIPNAGNTPYGRLTTSVGVTSLKLVDLTADDKAWLARADSALYEAKEHGRNRCEFGPETLSVVRRKANEARQMALSPSSPGASS
jgi:diguanylate cyclase (GGDEF)-like protein